MGFIFLYTLDFLYEGDEGDESEYSYYDEEDEDEDEKVNVNNKENQDKDKEKEKDDKVDGVTVVNKYKYLGVNDPCFRLFSSI